MTITQRPQLAQVGEIVHGAIDPAEMTRLGIDPRKVLDLSANTNPFGPSPHVRAALADVVLGEYPDRHATALRNALAERWQVLPQQVLVGNGATELIWLAALAFLDPGDRVLILGPTFGEYRRASQLMGATIHELTSLAAASFQFDIDTLDEALAELRPKLAFICQPNNPTGQLLSQSDLERVVRTHPATLFLIDEAYLDFVPDTPSAIRLAAENVLVLRSMTKFHGLAGLRLGYALADSRVISALECARPPWSVNTAAQQCGLAALADQQHAADSLARLQRSKDELLKALRVAGLAPLASVGPYFLVHVGSGARVRAELLRRNILVRDAASFGLPEYIRISTPRPEEIGRVAAKLREVL
jgi:histidinol-phosphate aminotransferase